MKINSTLRQSNLTAPIGRAHSFAIVCLAVAWLLALHVHGATIPPTIRGVSPDTANEGATVQLSAEVFDPDSTPPFEYLWRLPDGTFSTNAAPAVSFDSPGYYSIELVVADAEGNESAPFRQDLTVNNVAPWIEDLAPASGAEGQALAFSAAVKDAGRAERHRYEWTLPDGTKSQLLSPAYFFREPGSFPVSLTVRELGLEYSYNNSRDTGPRPKFFAQTNEAGDELVLAGTNRFVHEFQFIYYGDFTNLTTAEIGLARARVRIYAGDGPTIVLGGKNIVTPGALLYESASFPLQADYNWKSFRDLELTVPDVIMWTFTVEGLPQTPGKQAGLVFYHSAERTAADVGKSYGDFWKRDSLGNWMLYHFNGNPWADFGCRSLGFSANVIATSVPFTQSVVISNTPPTITAANITENGLIGAELQFSAVATDAGPGPLTYHWDFGDNAVADGAEVSHAFAAEGRFHGTLTVRDPQGATDTRGFDMSVSADRKALRFGSAPVTEVNQGAPYRYDISTITPGAGQTLQITAPILPAWLTLQDHGDGTALLTGSPAEAQVGSHAVTLQVGDGVTTANQSFTLFVMNVNDPPTISPLADQTVRADTELGPLAFVVSDPDNSVDDLRLTVSSSNQAVVPDAGLHLGGAAQNRWLTLRPKADQSGEAIVTVTVSDGELAVQASFLVTVTPVPHYTLALLPATGGQIVPDPAAPDYAAGTQVTLTARPDDGYAFTGWTGDASGQVNPLELTLNANQSVGANFKDVSPPLITILTPANGPSESETYDLTGTVRDNAAVASVEWEREGVRQGTLALADGHFSVKGLRLLRGENRLLVRATDGNSNTGSVAVVVNWAPGVVLTVGNPPDQREGKRINVPIKLTSKGDVGGLTFVLSYEAGFLSEPLLTWSSVAGSSLNQVSYETPGTVYATLSLPGTTVPAGVQLLATLQLHVRSVPFSLTTQIGAEVEEVSGADGWPLITSVDTFLGEARLLRRRVVGDLNANDRLDVGDAALLQRLIAGLDPRQTWDLALNDLNANNQLDSGDVVQVLRVVVGKDPQPPLGSAAVADASPQSINPSIHQSTNPPSSPLQPLAFSLQPFERTPQSAIRPASRLDSVAAALAAATQARGVLVLPTTAVKAGQQFTVQVRLEDVSDPITGASFRLRYPVEALQLAGPATYRAGALVPGDALVAWNHLPPPAGAIAFAATSAQPWPTVNGILAEFTFIVVGSVADETGWALSLEDLEVSKDGYENGELTAPLGAFQTGVQFPPSTIVSFSLQPEGRMEVQVRAEPGQKLLLESSVDLIAWQPYLTLPATTGIIQLQDPQASQFPRRFFRVKAFAPAGSAPPPTAGEGR